MKRRNKPRKKHRLVKFFIAILLLVGIGMMFIKFGNNTLRTLNSGKDTPVDKVVKKKITQKITSAADQTDNQEKKLYLDQAADFINKEPMSKIMEIANDEQQASQVLQSEGGIPKEIADEKVHELFASPDYSAIREAVAKGDYYGAYKEYQKLSK